MRILKLFITLISLICISNATELLISSNTKIPNSDQIAEYKGKIISVINEDAFIYTDGLGEFTIDQNVNMTVQTNQQVNADLWNLDSLDGNLDSLYNYQYSGINVIAYVIDSGITKSNEFGDRIKTGISFNPYGNITTDCLGHGTHVTSLIGSNTYGVAKNVNIVPVKVFNCEGTTKTSIILQAIYWVIKQPKGIVNLSIGGGYNTLLNSAISDLTNEGFIVIVAAGNDGEDACNHSPSSEKSAIVAGCSNIYNEVTNYSNEGMCVTLFAPGDFILGLNAYGGTIYRSGTSMSCPHITGVAATIYERYPGILQKDMKNMLMDMAANNTLRGFKIPTSPNLELRGFKEDSLPKCGQISKIMCLKTSLCIFIKNYGCRIINFCGFKRKKECILRKHCKYVSKNCMVK
jgi:subtilisin family serine protease